MLELERQQTILQMLEHDQFVRIKILAEAFSTSRGTIRRDLGKMSRQGLIVRIRGGAKLAAGRPSTSPPYRFPPFGSPPLREIPFEYRKKRNLEQKRAIARQAVDLCADHDTIIMDGSSTVYQMVFFMKKKELQVITNSFAVAEYLSHYTRNTMILSGGILYPDSQLLYDPFEYDFYRNYSVSKVFMGVKGLNDRGVSNSDALLIKVDQKIIDTGGELIILADSSKLEIQAELILCGYDKISTIITDAGITDGAREMILSKDVKLIVADDHHNETNQSQDQSES